MTPYTPDQVSRIDQLIRSVGIGVVYIVAHDPAGPVKIGKSTFLSMRLDGLQTGNPSQLYVFAAFIATKGGTLVREGRIHDELHEVRLKGEWFAMGVVDAKRACRDIIRRAKARAAAKLPEPEIVHRRGPSGTFEPQPKKPTNRAALRAVYKKHIAEMSLRVPQCPPKKSRKWALPT